MEGGRAGKEAKNQLFSWIKRKELHQTNHIVCWGSAFLDDSDQFL
jgi:hypothetical protein